MTSIEYDLIYLRAGIAVLEKYLFSSEMYWDIGVSAPPGETPYPPLTLGGMLLAQARLHGRQLTPAQRAEKMKLESQLNQERTRWRTAWGRKARAEFRARLNLWRDFLEDYRIAPEAHFDRYAFEVTRRVMLRLLEPEADGIPSAEKTMLAGLDQLLGAIFKPGKFIWQEDLAAAFPPDLDWYLYGSLPEREMGAR